MQEESCNFSVVDVSSRHRKELKQLEGEKRAAVKKAKTTKGGKNNKAAKDEISAVEAEYDRKLHEMRERHRRELADVEISATAAATTSVVAVEETEELETKVSNLQVVAAVTDGADGESAAVVAANEARERKLAKARRKRDKERAKELEREAAVAQELQSAGPSQRSVELQLIQSVLTPLHYQIGEIPADGHCLYRAVAAQTTTTYASTYQEIRALCADALMEHEADLAPFCELSDEMATFAEYVQSVRSSSRWGGHVELRALSLALSRPIHVYSAATAVAAASTNTDPPTTQHLPPPQPLILDDGTHEADAEPIRLCYHLHYYALGEHYNTVVPVADDKKEVDES